MPVLVGTPPNAIEEFPLDQPTCLYLGDSDIVLGNGILDSYGCRWRWVARNAWGNKPAPREQVGDRNYDHGQYDATRYYGPRTMPVTGHCLAPSHDVLHAAEQRLRNAVGVNAITVRVTEPGFDSTAKMRQQGETVWNEINPKVASFSLGLFAPDPRLYSSLERSFDLTFPDNAGGLQWPTTWPAVWDTSPSSGFASLLNPGNESVGIRLEVHGPAAGVAITLADTGQVLYVANPDGPLLSTGQYLVVDTSTRQVLLNGDANRRAWVYGDWLLLPPAATTTLRIAGTGTTTDSHVSGTYRAVRI